MKIDKMSRIKLLLSIIRFLPWSLYFNFRYLPFKQAYKLPILLYKPKLLKCKGSIVIESENVKTGMIRLGFFRVSLFPNSGITWENHGGKVIFKNTSNIGNNSFISIGEKGILIFGDGFYSTTSLKLTVYNQVEFGSNTLVGWDCTIMDTNFHKITKLSGGYTNSTSPIIIGSNNWFAAGCFILKGTITPDYCIFGVKSVLCKKYDFPSYSLASGNPVTLKSTGVYRNLHDDKIQYE